MKKFGFTLSELIITLSIIGVVAVAVMPALTNLVPDTNKITVLRYNTLIGNAVNDILNSDELYHPFVASRTVGETTEYFLTNNGVDECEGLSCVEGNIPNLLRTRIGDDDNVTLAITGNVADGFTLTLDTKPSQEGVIFAGVLQNVDTFIFRLNRHGRITAGDALTDAYMKNPLNMNDRKYDLEAARNNLESKTY